MRKVRGLDVVFFAWRGANRRAHAPPGYQPGPTTPIYKLSMLRRNGKDWKDEAEPKCQGHWLERPSQQVLRSYLWLVPMVRLQ